ncbi:MAG: SDR family oxidoreductase [Rhodospirillaceae bacterium]|nr:SDR family oxidoreductase [Rhodospirillaceae bacterium]
MKKLLTITAIGLGLIVASAANAATVLITGSNKGIGLEFAKEYAEKGWTVIATARHTDAAELQALAKAHKNIAIEKLDVTDLAGIQALAAKLKGKPIDLLINNAAMLGDTKQHLMGHFNRDLFRQIMDTNAYGPIAVTEAFFENIKASEQKKVVSITSQAGSISQSPYIGAILFYRMSKAAANMAMQSLKADTKGSGIIFASVAPGLVDTDMEKELGNALPIQMPKPISPAESVSGMIKVIDALTAQNSGKVFNYTGENIAF